MNKVTIQLARFSLKKNIEFVLRDRNDNIKPIF